MFIEDMVKPQIGQESKLTNMCMYPKNHNV
jgi:hypothetical protein